ncbi:unnamed protein product [Effrenium voratum]|nr:unnamed protein product [Effrenium voratum]
MSGLRAAPSGEALCAELLKEMRRRQLRPNLVVYSAAINVAGASGAWQQALAYHAEVETRKLKKDLVLLSSTMTACTKGLSWGKALELYHRELHPNTATSNAALSACAAGGHWQGALHILSTMDRDEISYVAAISACRASRQWQVALCLLSGARSVVSFSAAVAVLEAEGRWREALALLEVMCRTGPAPNLVSYNAAISACGKGQQWQRGLQLLGDLQTLQMEPGIIAWNAATSGCEKGRQWEVAEQLLMDAEASDLPVDSVTFSAAVSACEKGWQWSRSLQLLWSMRSRRLLEAVACNAALSACGECNEVANALTLFHEMVEERLANEVSCNAAIAACSAGGLWQDALQLLTRMAAANHQPPPATYNAVANACGRLGYALDLASGDCLGLLALAAAFGGSSSREQLRRLLGALHAPEAALVPRDEGLTNALGPPLALAEALSQEGLWVAWGAEFLRKRCRASFQRLSLLSAIPLRQARDPVLDQQNSLGAFFTQKALRHLRYSSDEMRFGWLGAPRAQCRRELQKLGLPIYSNEPAAQHLPAWASSPFTRGQTFGSEGGEDAEADSAILAVYVDHDRSSHAERRHTLGREREESEDGLLDPEARGTGHIFEGNREDPEDRHVARERRRHEEMFREEQAQPERSWLSSLGRISLWRSPKPTSASRPMICIFALLAVICVLALRLWQVEKSASQKPSESGTMPDRWTGKSRPRSCFDSSGRAQRRRKAGRCNALTEFPPLEQVISQIGFWTVGGLTKHPSVMRDIRPLPDPVLLLNETKEEPCVPSMEQARQPVAVRGAYRYVPSAMEQAWTDTSRVGQICSLAAQQTQLAQRWLNYSSAVFSPKGQVIRPPTENESEVLSYFENMPMASITSNLSLELPAIQWRFAMAMDASICSTSSI